MSSLIKKIEPVRRVFLSSLTVLVFSSLGGYALQSSAQGTNYGKPGDPIKLVVAHPCCYTEVWSVFAQSGKEFWKKYLPAGSTVEYQVGLQGSVVVNQLLAGRFF